MSTFDEIPPSALMSTRHQDLEDFCKKPSPPWPDFVCVSGRFRLGKLLGSGGSGEFNS